MGNALINFTQGATTGGAGFALMGTLSTSVVVSNGDDSDIVNWEFIVDDVGVGSSVPQGTVQDGGTPTWSFAPDATGCYVVTLITTDNQGNLYQDTRCFGVLENSGRFIPSYLATDEALNCTVSMVTNTKGWSPYLQTYLKAIDNIAAITGYPSSYNVDVTAGGVIPATFSIDVFAAGSVYFDGSPSVPWVAQFSSLGAGQGYILSLYNSTRQPGQVSVGGWSGPTIEPGGNALLVWDGQNDVANFFSLNSVNDTSSFEPSGPNMAPCLVNASKAVIQSYQTTPWTRTILVDIPLPGTTGSYIQSLSQPGLLTLDVSVRMQSTSTTDSAWFKMTWAWSVASVGSPASLGSAQVLGLAIGNSTGTPQAVPSGWSAVLQLDGGQDNAQVFITGDPSLLVDVSLQYEWNNLQ